MKHNKSIYAVILAGGAGERLWPASRISRPKYVMKLVNSSSVIQQTIDRLKGIVPSKNILIVTRKEQRSVIRKSLRGLGNRNFLIEPSSRNTAAAIGLAAMEIKCRDEKAVMLVLPADHYIRNKKAFHSAVKDTVNAAEGGYLVTLGIKPTFPATGFGYIKTAHKDKKGYYSVENFVEKPDRKTAEKFLKTKKYFWNTGMFVWQVNTILNGIKKYMPDLYRTLLTVDKTNISAAYARLKKISIDYGVMEKAKNRAMVMAGFEWTDLGSWLSLEDIYKKDKNKNIFRGLHLSMKAKNSIVFSSDDHLVTVLGVKNLLVVHTKDATLVADKKNAQEIKDLVNFIRKKSFKSYL